jgi:putative flippase GtrA
MALAHHFTRHQLASLGATLVDFGVMIACVRWLSWTPVTGTVAGATCGALTNFTLHRRWTFLDHASPLPGQGLRYAAVSAASLGWNVLGEWLLAMVAGVPYVAARLVVATVVGGLWNFPMHRYVVFPAGRSP